MIPRHRVGSLEHLARVPIQFNLPHIFQTCTKHTFTTHMFKAPNAHVICVRKDFESRLTSTRYMEFGRLSFTTGGDTPFYQAIDLSTSGETAEGASELMADMILSIGHDD